MSNNSNNNNKNNQYQHEEEEEAAAPAGCGIFGRYPLITLITFAALGIACGVGLSNWDDDGDAKTKTIKWIGLLGDLFIRALKCLVLPLIFVSVTISVLDMMAIGRAGSVGVKTIVLYLSTTLIASTIGILSIICFRGTFQEGTPEMRPPPTVELGCDAGLYLTEGENGSVSCAPANGTKSQFFITDIFGSFASGSDGGPSGDVSMSDTVYDGIFTKIVTDNIFGEFTDANFAAIVFFAIFFAVAINQVFLVEGESAKAAEGEGDVIIRFLKALDKIFLKMIQWVIMVTPFAVFSLITQAIGEQDDIAEAFSNVGFLIVAFVVGIILQFLVVHVGMFFFFTKRNPFVYLKHIIPAQTMAFACASSAATIPVTLKSVRSTGWVPEPILRFVVPLGATVNMDGSAIYYPMACVWLAYLNGIQPNPADYVLLVILGTLGSIGAAPVPYSSLVLIITAYNTVFGGNSIPKGIPFLAGIDWFIGSLRTVTNVTGDAVVCAMVANLCPISEGSEMDQMMKASNLQETCSLPLDDSDSSKMQDSQLDIADA